MPRKQKRHVWNGKVLQKHVEIYRRCGICCIPFQKQKYSKYIIIIKLKKEWPIAKSFLFSDMLNKFSSTQLPIETVSIHFTKYEYKKTMSISCNHTVHCLLSANLNYYRSTAPNVQANEKEWKSWKTEICMRFSFKRRNISHLDAMQ